MFPPGGWPAWADHNMWAPEIHFVSGLLSIYIVGDIIEGDGHPYTYD